MQKIYEYAEMNSSIFEKIGEWIREDEKIFHNLDWLDYSFDELEQKQRMYYESIKDIFLELDLIDFKNSNRIFQEYKQKLIKIEHFQSLYFSSFWEIKRRYVLNLNVILNLFREFKVELDIIL